MSFASNEGVRIFYEVVGEPGPLLLLHTGGGGDSRMWRMAGYTDGLSATRLISAEQPDVNVVILTASEEDAHLFEAIKSGDGATVERLLERDRALVDARDETGLSPVLVAQAGEAIE